MKKILISIAVLILILFIRQTIKRSNDIIIGNITSIDTVLVYSIPVYNTSTVISTIVPTGYPLTDTGRITSPWGERINPVTKKRHFHDGIDIRVDIGNPVIATADGQAVRMKGMKGALLVKIYHEDDYSTMYAHLSEIFITEYLQDVLKGDTIGLSGNTGETTGPHLHYEVRKDKESIDPVTMFTIGN